MALARIITRSQACSRELALDLLARGYAVEIVSPDRVPDNIADLELRVEAGPGDRLVASVGAYNGERSASLEFVHHLKAPMVDFIRRPPEPGDAVLFPKAPVSFKAKQSIEDVELPAEAPQLAAKAVSPTAGIPLCPEPVPGFDTEQGARPILPPEPSPPPPMDPPGYFAVDDSAVARPTIAQSTNAHPTIARSRQSSSRRDRSAGWLGRAALTFASVVLLAVVLGFSMRRTGKAAAQGSATLSAEKVAAASTEVNLSSAVESDGDSGQVPLLATPPAAKSDGNRGPAPKESSVAKDGAATANPRARIPPRHGDDLIARDTVTYLDKSFEPRAFRQPAPKAKPAKRFARQHPSSRKPRGAVIAASKATYLRKPAPKAAQ